MRPGWHGFLREGRFPLLPQSHLHLGRLTAHLKGLL